MNSFAEQVLFSMNREVGKIASVVSTFFSVAWIG